MNAESGTAQRLRSALADRYRIERELGAGGMATVYLAEDLKHDRKVAIKVLHPDLGAALGAERFLSEIKTTAKLQHPHVLPLLDSGAADGLLYYVMPLVTGETLRDRLAREQQLPIGDAVSIASEVADALGYAHAQGIIHRDVKPENILLQGGHALVADFGIALAVQQAGGARMTQTGLSLGTPQYMSPEQAMGERTIDARSDVYALGAVTYEMLTGEAPFTGVSVQAIVAKVLTERPTPPTSVRDTVPLHVESAVLTALAKLPADRQATVGDFAAQLKGAMATAHHAATANTARGAALSRTAWRTRVLLAGTTTLALAGGVSTYWFATRTAPGVTAAAVQFDVSLPDSVALYAVSGRRLAVSRDGTQLVVVGVKHDSTRLYVRRMDEATFREIRGTEAVEYSSIVDPVFSPDGASILFRGRDALYRVAVKGGRAERIGPGVTASWGDGERIVFTSGDSVLEMHPDGSGTRVIRAGDTTRVSWVSILPGGHYALANTNSREGKVDQAQIVVVSLDDGSIQQLGVNGTNALYAGDGRIVFGRTTGEVFAMPFSLSSRKPLGPPVRILEGVWVGGTGAVGVAVSENGVLTYHDGESGYARRVLWSVGTDGTEQRLPAAEQEYMTPRVSPDGLHVVLENNLESVLAHDRPLLLLDVKTGAVQRLAAPGEGFGPEWTRDGKRVVFLKLRDGGGRELISRAWDRSTPDQVLIANFSTPIWDVRIGPPGGFSVLRTGDEGAATMHQDILLGPTDSLALARPFIATAARELMPDISPDGRWLAYASDESGRLEVYVQPIPGPGARLQVSIAGGGEPLWSPKGSTLFYRSAERTVMAAHIEPAPLRVAKWDTLFTDRYKRSTTKLNWSVFPDGKRFLMTDGSRTVGGVKALVNWMQLPVLTKSEGAAR